MNKLISSPCTLDSPACYTVLLNNLAAECILVEDTTRFIPVIALPYHWHYGRDGFAAVNPQTPYKEKENGDWNQARGQLPASGGLASPSSWWSCGVPNSVNQVFFSFPSSLALVRAFPCPLSFSVSTDSLLDVYLHGPQVMEGRLGHSQCVPEQALTICPWKAIHSRNFWRAQLKKAFSRLWSKPWERGKTIPTQELLYEPPVWTVTCP